MDRHRRLASKRREKADLLGREAVLLVSQKRENPQRFALYDERDAEIRDESLATIEVVVMNSRIDGDVVDDERSPGLDDRLHDRRQRVRIAGFPRRLVEVPAGGPLPCRG